LRPFLDTNILVYAVSDDRRQQRAQELLAAGGTISVQVLGEFANVLRNKLRKEWPDIEAALEDICVVLDPATPLTVVTHRVARTIARDHGLSFYDALIAAAALEAKCDTLLSEDMQDGRIIPGLKITNPFASPPP
jgi:predicted nucleic acid-binding protein